MVRVPGSYWRQAEQIGRAVYAHCVHALGAMLTKLHALLRPGGKLLVSGPTENRMYRLGRRIVGFSGEYHHHNIYDVLAAMRGLFRVQIVRRMPWFCPLFLIAAGARA